MSNPPKRQLAGFLVASSLGTFLEFFDIALYSFCASIIAMHFFPAGDKFVAILSTWGIFALSYLMRPLGAILFGYMADMYSGRKAMIISMSSMALATTAIGLLPTYNSVGVLAPILLLLCRIVQSIAVSPEYNLPSVFMKNNNWFQDRFGLTSSISACVTGLGIMSASWVMGRALADTAIEDVSHWQWRLPFIISGILVGSIGVYLRLNLSENMISKPKHSPISKIFKNQDKDFFMGATIAGYIGCISYALFGFLIHQLQHVRNISPGEALQVLSSGMLLPSLFSLLSGYLSDLYPRSILMFISAIIMAISGSCLFFAIDSISTFNLYFNTWIMLAALGFFAGGFPGYLAEIFAKEYRYTGSFLSYNIGMSWIGGISPIMFISLYKLNSLLPVIVIVAYSILVIKLITKSNKFGISIKENLRKVYD